MIIQTIKNKLFILLFAFALIAGFTNQSQAQDDKETFTIVEELAKPQGGMKDFYDFIKKNLVYPDEAKKLGIEGKVFLTFIVQEDGSLTDIKVMRGVGSGCDEEAIRILKLSPNWIPGKQRGRVVKQKMTFPIMFKLTKKEEKEGKPKKE